MNNASISFDPLDKPGRAAADRKADGALSVKPGQRGLTLAAGLSVLAVFVVCRPYIGVLADAIVYIGRAAADLDPHGLGQGLDFVHDGQSAFSLFPWIARLAVAALGPGAGAEALVAAGLALWLATASLLVSRFVSGVRLWTALIALAALPAAYGAPPAYHFAEALATPRVFAEAAALAGLAALVSGRKLLAFALLLAAALLHPLIALGPWAVAMVLLIREDRRWLAAPLLAAGAGLTAALLGLPVAQRLFETPDPAWRAVIALRTAPVFVTLWRQGAWALLACQAGTALAAAAVASERDLRIVLLAAVGVAIAGVAVALLPSLLILQVQPWRAQWLLAVLAAASWPLAAAGLWRRGEPGRAALALLALAWLCRDSVALAGPCVVAALALLHPAAKVAAGRWLVLALWAAVAGVALMVDGLRVVAAVAALARAGRFSLSVLGTTGVPSDLFGALAAAVAIRAPVAWPARRQLAALGGAILALAAGLYAWDDRSPFTRWSEGAARAPALRALTPDGQVYWPGDYGVSWMTTGRPEWSSPFQGAGVVFDRPLAMAWAARQRLAEQAGLAPPSAQLPVVGPSSLRILCAALDGPDWIVAPVASLTLPSLAAQGRTWRAPAPQRLLRSGDNRPVDVADYVVFACRAGNAALPRSANAAGANASPNASSGAIRMPQ